MAEKTAEEQAVIDAALAWYDASGNVFTREEWVLVQAIENMPRRYESPLYG